MKRVRSVVAAACLMLCVVLAIVWLRGYFVSESVGYGLTRPDRTMTAAGFGSGQGGLGFVVLTGMPYQEDIDGLFREGEPPGYAGSLGSMPARGTPLGFMLVRLPLGGGAERGWAGVAPMWAVLLAAGVVPAWHFWG